MAAWGAHAEFVGGIQLGARSETINPIKSRSLIQEKVEGELKIMRNKELQMHVLCCDSCV